MPDTTEGAAPRVGGITVRSVVVSIEGSKILGGVDLDASAGSSLAILGPSGCGKTTLLRVLAGLQPIDEGRVTLDDDLVNGPNIHVAPERRNVGMVFQDWALFPHLTVMANVVFGLGRAERKNPGSNIAALLEMVGLGGLESRYPRSLSGGQRQRVALARALAPQPGVLLLDEPFSSLDTNLRVEVRSEVSELLRHLGVTSVFVTHDQDEAFVLGDQVAVMRDGVVTQQATPSELYSRPADRWLAGFVGDADTILGTASGSVARTELGSIGLVEPLEGRIEVLIRPEELRICAGEGATVTRVEFFGHDTLYGLVTDGGALLRCRVSGSPDVGVESRVSVSHSGVATVGFSVG